ncbi:MAG: hypothetical protein ACUVTZ_11645, partial [Armatimonadota bacterium]
MANSSRGTPATLSTALLIGGWMLMCTSTAQAASGLVQGTVSAVGGSPAGLTVELVASDGSVYRSTQLGTEGRYSLTATPATYTV